MYIYIYIYISGRASASRELTPSAPPFSTRMRCAHWHRPLRRGIFGLRPRGVRMTCRLLTPGGDNGTFRRPSRSRSRGC